MSGVYFLPNVCSQILIAMVSATLGTWFRPWSMRGHLDLESRLTVRILANNCTVQKLDYYLPSVLTGSLFSAIAYGLLSMLTPTYPTVARVGHQIIAGFGC